MLFDLPIIFDTWTQLLGTALVLILAEGIYVSFGFGAGMIAVGLLATLLPSLADVVVLLLLVNVPVELVVVGRAWRRMEARGVVPLAVGLLVGVPLGTWLLEHGRPVILLAVLGAFLVVTGAAFLLRPALRRHDLPRWSGPVTGLLAGALTGLFGTGGPPLIFYYQLRGVEKSVFRGSLITLFFAMTLVRVPTYALAGLLTPARLASAGLLLPAVALGAWLGHRLHVQLSEAAFRRFVSVLLILLGISLVLRG